MSDATKRFTQAEMIDVLSKSKSLQRAQLLAEGLTRALVYAAGTPQPIFLLAIAHVLVEPLMECVAPLGADGKPDAAATVMVHDLPHEKKLRIALQEYMGVQSFIVGAKDEGIDVLAPAPKDTPGECIGCGKPISANKDKCLACAEPVQ